MEIIKNIMLCIFWGAGPMFFTKRCVLHSEIPMKSKFDYLCLYNFKRQVPRKRIKKP